MSAKVIVGIVTMNFRLLYRIQNAISSYFTFDHFLLTEDLSAARVIVTSRKEYDQINHPKKIPIDLSTGPSGIRGLIIKAIKEDLNEQGLIGVDPGKTIGVAVIYKKSVLITEKMSSIEELIFWIKNQLWTIPKKDFIIKVGHGEQKYFSDIYKRIQSEFSEKVYIISVSEHRTSIRGSTNRSIHEEAAIRIAKRE